jgi:hypothetical protein
MKLSLDIIKEILKYNNINKVPIYIISKKYNKYYSNFVIKKFLKIRSIKDFSNTWILYWRYKNNFYIHGPLGKINSDEFIMSTYLKILQICNDLNKNLLYNEEIYYYPENNKIFR